MRRIAAAALIMLVTSTVGRSGDFEVPAPVRDGAGRILGAALVDDQGWQRLEHLATVIGHRLSGSEGLERAVEWAAAEMGSDGLEVRLQPVEVAHWVRGRESAEVVAPVPRILPMLGLGMSVGTPPEGIEAEAVVVGSFDELEALERSAVEGRIVVYAVPWSGYGETVRYRVEGASRAAALGAVAALVRSATGHSLATPHTGMLRYDPEQPRIPAAAITPEDADWFRRMAARGLDVRVRLKMDAENLPEPALSHNVVAEIPGRERSEEVVVMGCHLDSWDVGEGVHDDGAACIAAWQALTLIRRLDLTPRRTLRVVLWTNEENGLAGGPAYHDQVGDEVTRHVAAIEMDSGCERPVGFGFGLIGHETDGSDPRYEQAFATLESIGRLLEPLDAGAIFRGGGGADIGPLMKDGVPGLSLRTVGERYFDWHHSPADTLDKVDPVHFRRATAMLAVMGWSLAELPEPLLPGNGGAVYRP